MTDVLEISSKTSPYTRFLGWCVDTDEDKISILDSFVDICREKKVATACLTDNVCKTRFVDWEFVVWAIPRIDTVLIKIDNGNLDMGALECDDSARGTAYKYMRHDRSSSFEMQYAPTYPAPTVVF